MLSHANTPQVTTCIHPCTCQPRPYPIRAQDPSFDPVAAKTLLQEVWEVVDTNYLDARGSGFDRERWRALRDEMMGREYTNMRGVHRYAG